MAITIPILTDFDGSGINKATKKFQDLEGVGAKAHFALRKAALPAAAALAAVGVAAVDSVKGAIEDQAAQEKLAGALKRTTGANTDALKATEDFISSMSSQRAIADDELRPALATLARGTGDLAKAQEGLSLATDIAAATGRPLEGVATALSKAYTGQYGALAKLDPSMKALIKSGAGTDEIMGKLTERFGGSAADAANTASGRMKGLGIALDETKESIGAALLPALNAVLPVLQAFGNWAQQHPGVFLAIAGAIAGVAVAIGVANVAMTLMALNPVALTIMAVVAAVALAAVGFTLLWQKSETFRKIVTTAWEAVQDAVKVVVNYLKGPVMAAWDIIQGAFEVIKGIITGDFSAAWDGLKTMIGGVVDWIKTTLLDLPITILTAAASIGKAIVDGIVNGVATLGEMTWAAIKGLPGFLAEKVPEWLTALGNIGISVITWIASKITGLAAAAWENIQDFPTALWNLITQSWDGIKEWGGKLVGWIASTAGSLAGDIWEKIKGFPGDVWEKIKGLEDTFVGWGVKLVKWVVSGIGSLGNAIGKALFGGIDSGGTGSVPPSLRPKGKPPAVGAAGGIVTQPTFALIGEAGPEALIPLDQMPGAFPLSRGGRGSTSINISVSAGLVSTPDQIGQQIIEAIQSAQRRSGPVFAAA